MPKTLEDKVHELWAVRQIESVLNAYCRGFDRCDLAGAKATFWPDALVDHPGFCGNAAGMCEQADGIHHERFESTQHYVTNNEIEVNGSTAHAETYFIMAARPKGSHDMLLVGGRYVRRLEERGGAWRIAAHTCIVEWSSSREAAQAVMALSAKAARDPTDFVYHRPLEITREQGTAAVTGL